METSWLKSFEFSYIMGFGEERALLAVRESGIGRLFVGVSDGCF